jgi:hypothetical protein
MIEIGAGIELGLGVTMGTVDAFPAFFVTESGADFLVTETNENFIEE